MKNFKNALKDLERADSILEELQVLALRLGMKELGMNVSNASSVCFKALYEYIELKETAEKLGTTLSNSLKSYRMRNKTSDVIPLEMRFAPPHWISETSVEKIKVWKDCKLVDKVYKNKEITAATAQRLRAGLQPQILSLFLLLEEQDWNEEEKESYRNQVVSAYKSESYRDFSEQLIDALWRMNVSEDEELIDCANSEELPEESLTPCCN